MKKVSLLIGLLFPAGAIAGDGASDFSEYEGKPIGSVIILGHKTTRDYVIWREIESREGRSFSEKTLNADVQRLDNLDIFSSIRVDVQPSETDQEVDVSVNLREVPPVVPYPSYEITDENGFSIGPAVKAVNMFGRDIYVAGFALFGGKTTFLTTVNHPWIAGDHISLDLRMARIQREVTVDDFEETSLEFTPWVGMYLGRHGRIKAGFSYFRMQSNVNGITLSPSNTDNLFRAGFGVGYDSRNSWGNPQQGWLNEIEVIKTGGVLPGEGNFTTLNVDLRRFQRIPSTTRHSLALGTLLTLQSGTVGESLPPYLDYHLGGANSIRGYVFEDLGEELFGKNQLLSTVEYRWLLIEPREFTLFGLSADLGLQGALFADNGLAWNDKDEFSLNDSKTGFGAGLRILMPAIEMSRLDVAFSQDGDLELHLLLSFSKFQAQRTRLR